MKGSEAHFNATAPIAHPHSTPSKKKQAGEEAATPPSHNTPSVCSSRKQHSWDELVMRRGNFSGEQMVLQSIDSEAFSERMRTMEQGDFEHLVKNVHRLERLIALNRDQRKIENSRHEEDMKQLARELSLKEAEVICLREELEGAQVQAGQLLDQYENTLRERDQLQLAVENERTAAQKLQVSYDALSVRVAQHCQQTQTIQTLRDELSLAIKQRLQALREVEQARSREDKLRQQVDELERQLWQSQQTNQELAGKLQELNEELDTKQDIVKKYEQKLSEIEEKIDSMEQEEQFVHRISYSAHSPHANQETIRIEEQNDCHLRKIVQEELEESFPSLEDHLRKSQQAKSHHEIVTATTLIDGRELELLQLLTQNLQREHSQLKHLYRQQQEIITQKHVQLQNLEKSLAQMRYEFLLELSRVTALMNQQILENRALRQQNMHLQSKIHKQQQLMVNQQSFNQTATKYHTLHKTLDTSRLPSASIHIGNIQRETCQRARCRQLQEDNRMLLKYNMQREQIYEMMISSKVESSDIIVQRFENSFKYILQHKQRYASLLRNYGFDIMVKSAKEGSQIVEQGHSDEKLSDIINNFSTNRKENYSEIQKFEIFQSQNENQLLLQSTAKELKPEPSISLNNIQSTISSLAQLYKEREKMLSFKKNKTANQIDHPKQRQKIVAQIHLLKLNLMKECAEIRSKSIIATLKQLERDIDQLCYT